MRTLQTAAHLEPACPQHCSQLSCWRFMWVKVTLVSSPTLVTLSSLCSTSHHAEGLSPAGEGAVSVSGLHQLGGFTSERCGINCSADKEVGIGKKSCCN